MPRRKSSRRRRSYSSRSSLGATLRRPIVQVGILLVVAVVIFLIASLGGEKASNTGTLPAFVSVDEAHQMYTEGTFVLDVRTPEPNDRKARGQPGGVRSFNIAIFAAANTIAEEIGKPRSLAVDVEDAREVEIERVAKKSIDVLRLYGADASNAALVTAAMLYWAGAAASAGLPTPNRKLGGLCRMAADAPASYPHGHRAPRRSSTTRSPGSRRPLPSIRR